MTDDELGQLREMLKVCRSIGPQEIDALLERLDAAESALTAECDCDPLNAKPCPQTRAQDAWLKVCGR